MLRIRNLSQHGDTIIEVLLAITVVSAVLGGAFISANRSLIGARQSQERGEALKVAEGQLDKVKALASDSTKGIFNPPYAYCIDSSPLLNKKPAGDPACKFGTDGRYVATVTYLHNPTDDFTVQVKWDSLGGGTDQIVINYRLHP